MAKTFSMVKQCADLARHGEINCIGESKLEAKQTAIVDIKAIGGKIDSSGIGQRTGIHSINSLKANLNTWIEASKFIKAEFGVKNIYDIRAQHIGAYLQQKMEQPGLKVSSYMDVCSRLEKFGVALRWESGATDGRYSFSDTIKDYREEGKVILTENTKVNRAFENPAAVANAMTNPLHSTAAQIMYQGGARISEVSELKERNLLANNQILLTNTKGGEKRKITVASDVFQKVFTEIKKNGAFKIDQETFRLDIKQASTKTGECVENGPHGLRYNFAQNEYKKCLNNGMTVQQAKLHVSEKLGHHRADITERYICK